MTGALSREGACFLWGRKAQRRGAEFARRSLRERKKRVHHGDAEGTQRPRRVSPRELNLNPRQAIRAQQQRQFPGVG